MLAHLTLGQIQAVDPNHLRDFIIIAICALTSAASIVAMVNGRRTQRREVSFAESFVTKENYDSVMREINRRVGHLESLVNEVWTTMRDEDTATRNHMNTIGNDMERAIGRLEGKMEEVAQTMRDVRMLAERALERATDV